MYEARVPVREKLLVYFLYIAISCLFTSGLNIIHAEYLLDIPLTPEAFIAPLVAGVLFGYLLARIKILHETMSQMAYTDPLTHIYNRLHFGHFLESEIDRVERYGNTFSIIFFDIDDFKEINDEYGHLVGDEVLEEMTDVIKKANRSADIFARYGGEEFIIMTPATGIDGARQHAERLRIDIEKHEFLNVGTLRCSFGVTEYKRGEDNLPSLIKRADSALYKAKTQGKNRVETS
jgi:diguanylate cyclase (GGDEF)-like protein